MIGLNEVRQARETIGGRVHRTPMIRSATLSRMTRREVHLKLENLQKTGSFKPRGAVCNLERLDAAARRAGVITISAGNHAQGVAWAAAEMGIHAVVVMPASASRAKAEAARGYGAEVILHGGVKEAFELVERLRQERGLAFVHPFDDDATIAGQGTVGLEIVEDLPRPDAVIVGIGGGGLISGVALAVKELAPAARLIGVEPTGAAVMHLSRQRGEPARMDRLETIADGLAAPFAGARNFEIVERYVDDLVQVTDAEIIAAMRLLLERCKVLAEPAGAAATAALLSDRLSAVPEGARVAVVVSGGNVALETLAGYLRD